MVASVEGDGNHILKFKGNYSFRLNRNNAGGQFIHIFKHAKTCNNHVMSFFLHNVFNPRKSEIADS